MSQTVFEYTDDKGQTHQVDSIGQVPKQYMKTMLAIGGEPDEPQTGKTAQPEKPAAPDPNTWSGSKPVFLKGPAIPKAVSDLNINPNIAFPLIVALLLWRTKSYFLKIVLITATVFWGFYHLYSWFEGSQYAQTGDKIKKTQAR